MKTLIYAPLLLLLSACQQSPNPYQAEGLPYPPAPAAAAGHFDSSAYPPAPRDFALYRSWSWQNDQLPAGDDWASSQLLSDSLSGGLDQIGLRPAQNPAAPDLHVSAQLDIVEVEIIQPRETGAYYGNGPYGDGYGVGGRFPLRSSYRQALIHLQINFFDAHSQQLVWRGNAEVPSSEDRTEQAESLRQAVRQALSNYPPH